MELKEELLERARGYQDLSRWEKSELGKDLRREGLSYGEIMGLIPVKKSTLATWCNSVGLTDAQINAMRKRNRPRTRIPRDTQRKRRLEIDSIKARATLDAELLVHDPMWTTEVALYWAEGGKTRNNFEVANSDPRVLRAFISWVRTYHTANAEFALHINLHASNDELAARRYWRKALGLPDAKFHKTFIKPDETGHRKDHLPHGVCRV